MREGKVQNLTKIQSLLCNHERVELPCGFQERLPFYCLSSFLVLQVQNVSKYDVFWLLPTCFWVVVCISQRMLFLYKPLPPAISGTGNLPERASLSWLQQPLFHLETYMWQVSHRYHSTSFTEARCQGYWRMVNRGPTFWGAAAVDFKLCVCPPALCPLRMGRKGRWVVTSWVFTRKRYYASHCAVSTFEWHSAARGGM